MVCDDADEANQCGGPNATCRAASRSWAYSTADGTIRMSTKSKVAAGEAPLCVTGKLGPGPSTMVIEPCAATSNPKQRWNVSSSVAAEVSSSSSSPSSPSPSWSPSTEEDPGGYVTLSAHGRCLTGPRIADYDVDVYAGPVSGGKVVVVLLNRGAESIKGTVEFTDLDRVAGQAAGQAAGWTAQTKAAVRDVWARSDLGTAVGSWSAEIESHGVAMVVLTKGGAGKSSIAL